MTKFSSTKALSTALFAGSFVSAALGAALIGASFGGNPLSMALMGVVAAGCMVVAALMVLGGRSYAAITALSLALIGTFQIVTTPAQPTLALASVAGDTASVKRQWDGHFRAFTEVNGNPVEMLVDTGASLILLTYEDASAAGLDMDALVFDAPILTANGRSHVATVTLDAVSVDGVAATNIRGAVAQPGMLHASLLGMSFLGAIEEAVIRKDQLILKN